MSPERARFEDGPHFFSASDRLGVGGGLRGFLAHRSFQSIAAAKSFDWCRVTG